MLLRSPRSGVGSSPLQRVYRTKFALVAVASTLLGATLIVLAHWAAVDPTGAWLRTWPVNELGLGLFTTGLFGVLFHYVGQRDAAEDHIERIRRVIADDLAGRPDGLVAMVSSETRDRIVENCLRLQLGDEALAHDLYADLRAQLVGDPERRYDMDLSVALAPWAGGPATGRGAMFVATIRREYRLRSPRPMLRFTCVSDLEEYRESLRDPSCTLAHYFEPIGGLDGASTEAFELVELTTDGRPRSVRRSDRTGAQTYTANLGTDAATAREVTISYTYRVLVQQHGHLLHLDLSKPTNGLRVQFAYGDCGIRHVTVLDYIAGGRQPGLSRLPASGPTPSIALRFDGWILPKAGVAFVWVLEREMAPAQADGRRAGAVRAAV